MNIALIFAGGTGKRMNNAGKPKQFLELHGKPIIIYTLEHFQNHPDIDGIVLVCIDDWIDYCKKLLEKYGIDKVKVIVPGGATGQESIFNGLSSAHELYDDDTTILIHDGVRPLINHKTISDDIACVKHYGNAITVSSAIETIFRKNSYGVVGEILDRQNCEMAKAPQCFILKDIYDAHLQARIDDNKEFIDSASLMQYYGHNLYTVIGPSENIKITTPLDFYVFKAIIEAKENWQVLGV